MSKSKRVKFAESIDTATGGEVRRFRPSHIRATHDDNQRWVPYDTMPELIPFVGEKCCFPADSIERLLKSLLIEGQIDEIKVSVTGTGHPELEVGFRRHCAFLLAEARGLVEKIPGAKGIKTSGIRAVVVKAPNSQEGHAQRARRNYAENNERAKLSPVDRALYFKRRLAAVDDDGKSMTRQQLANELGCHVDHVNKHLRLFKCLKPAELLEVHEGRLPLNKALRGASKRGSGSNSGERGRNPGISLGKARKRFDVLDVKDVPESITVRELMLARLIAGAIDVDETDEDVPEDLQEFVALLDTTPPKPEKPKRSRKKAPPKPAKQN